MTYSEEDFERVYDEDELVTIRKGDLRAVLDVATGSMDFCSGCLDNEQVEALRKLADIIGLDPMIVTPYNFTCVYKGNHVWSKLSNNELWGCSVCYHINTTDPT